MGLRPSTSLDRRRRSLRIFEVGFDAGLVQTEVWAPIVRILGGLVAA